MKRIFLPVAAVGALAIAGLTLVGAAPASAGYRVGVGEQNAQMFDSPSWRSLGLKRVRLLVPGITPSTSASARRSIGTCFVPVRRARTCW